MENGTRLCKGSYSPLYRAKDWGAIIMLHGSDQFKYLVTDRFHYELSFSKDNIQGVLYEPWHWRFVGDDHSLQTFYAQRKLAGLLTTCDTWQIISLTVNDSDHRLLYSLWGGALRPKSSHKCTSCWFTLSWECSLQSVVRCSGVSSHTNAVAHEAQIFSVGGRETCAGPSSTQIYGKPCTRILR